MENIPAEVAPIPRALLDDADEVFAATTAGGVMPVARVGAHILGNDRPGPLSLRLKSLYWRRHAEGWHRTPVRMELGEFAQLADLTPDEEAVARGSARLAGLTEGWR